MNTIFQSDYKMFRVEGIFKKAIYDIVYNMRFFMKMCCWWINIGLIRFCSCLGEENSLTVKSSHNIKCVCQMDGLYKNS